MSKQNISAWFFEGGAISIPKNLMGLMEPLGLSFEDLGKIMYLLYCGTDQIMNDDRYAVEAARTLHGKGMINWFVDQHLVDFSPMFDKISQSLGDQPVYVHQQGFTAEELNYSDMIKRLEKQGRFLTLKEKQTLQEAVQRYNWSYDLVYEVFTFYQKNYRRHSYDFGFFCKMAFGAKVTDLGSFQQFIESLETSTTRVIEVLKRIGKYNNPTEAQKEMYLKWVNSWKFTHEMILLAADDTINANNPSFGYMDTMLDNWRELAIDTPEKLKEHKQLMLKEKQRFGKGNAHTNKQVPKENFASEARDLNFLIE